LKVTRVAKFFIEILNQKILTEILAFYKAPDFYGFFQLGKHGSGKTLSELHIYHKSLLTRVYGHAGCKEYCKDFTVALKTFDVFDKKQMYDSVITAKENAYKNWIITEAKNSHFFVCKRTGFVHQEFRDFVKMTLTRVSSH